MTTFDADIAVLGAGFGGSLTALLCERIGLRAVLIERGTHPRFAIGESSTPMADLVLGGLCDRYDLPRIRPLTHYGTWKRAYPDIACGLKRGFSYFQHVAGEPFVARRDHVNELLVAANPNDELGDTHWYRPDVDHFILREAVAAGVEYFDRTVVERLGDDDPWTLVARRDGSPMTFRAPFIVDATGANSVVASSLGIRSRTAELNTNSRSVFSHFTGVRRWHDVYASLGGRVTDHPFDCDAAALQHVFDGGWMWVLRFDNGITSAGFVLEPDFALETDESLSPADEWALLLRRFPTIAEQFSTARAVYPMQRTRRLQRRAERAAGPTWAMLPHAAYFLDPLFSAGNAHTLLGIERLIPVLATAPNRETLLADYNRKLQSEIDLLDRIIHGAYRGFSRFELLAAYSMFYFAAATFSEEERRAGRSAATDEFLLAHDHRFRSALESGYDRVRALASESRGSVSTTADFAAFVKRSIAPYNRVGLADIEKRNMYPYEPVEVS